jgi:hypothetical protein
VDNLESIDADGHTVAVNGVSLNIDPGSSVTTAVCRLPGGATLPLTIDGLPYLPSAVTVTPDGTIHTGAIPPADGHVIPSPFLALAATDTTSGNDDADTATAVEAAAAVLRRLATEATAATGLPVTELRIVVPPAWGPRRRALVRQAAAAAALPVPDLPSAPAAIAVGAGHSLGITVPLGGFLLVCDIGTSGTTASVVRRRTDIDAEVVSTISAADAIVTTGTGPTAAQDPAAALPAPDFTRCGAVAVAAVEAADLDPADLAGVVVVGGGARLPGAAAAVTAAVGVDAVVPARPEQAVVLAAAQTTHQGASGRWALTRPLDGLLRLLAPAVVVGIASLVLVNHAMMSAYVHTETGGWIDYVLFNSGEFAAACTLALVAALSAARLLILADLDRAQTSPARRPHPGRVFLSAAGAGLLVVIIYALLTGIYLRQDAGVYLSLGFKAAVPIAAAGALAAALSPRLAYLGGTAFDRLRYPVTAAILATAGIAIIQYAENTPLPATAVDVISRVGGALAGAGCAWTLIRGRGGRMVAVPLLAAIGALAASVDTNHRYGTAYIACIWFWYAQSLTGLVTDAFPDLRTWAQQWRPRRVRPSSTAEVLDLSHETTDGDWHNPPTAGRRSRAS